MFGLGQFFNQQGQLKVPPEGAAPIAAVDQVIVEDVVNAVESLGHAWEAIQSSNDNESQMQTLAGRVSETVQKFWDTPFVKNLAKAFLNVAVYAGEEFAFRQIEKHQLDKKKIFGTSAAELAVLGVTGISKVVKDAMDEKA